MILKPLKVHQERRIHTPLSPILSIRSTLSRTGITVTILALSFPFATKHHTLRQVSKNTSSLFPKISDKTRISILPSWNFNFVTSIWVQHQLIACRLYMPTQLEIKQRNQLIMTASGPRNPRSISRLTTHPIPA